VAAASVPLIWRSLPDSVQKPKQGLIDIDGPSRSIFNGPVSPANPMPEDGWRYQVGPVRYDGLANSSRNVASTSEMAATRRRVVENIVKSRQARLQSDFSSHVGRESDALFARYKSILNVSQKANHLVDSLRSTGQLPANYVTKQNAKAAGWKHGKAVGNSVPGGQLGGDVYRNDTGILPSAPGRVWYEADVGLNNAMSRPKQPGTRLLYSSDGLFYVTDDHYFTAYPFGGGSW
jgi:hypothetical protein